MNLHESRVRKLTCKITSNLAGENRKIECNESGMKGDFLQGIGIIIVRVH